MTETEILLLLIPILVIQLALVVVALRDLLQPDRRVRGDSKLMWGVVVIAFGIIGPILYFAIGRQDD